ncbi:MAG TPA: Fic family protein [Anaerolineae bacterium]|nr:Fic family protein [Anaerolineae bacterium]HQI85469.1 Fic family protein [Anaerolineae bacterium]
MDDEVFQDSPAGRVVQAIGGHRAFVPNPLPPQLTWSVELVQALSAADRAVGYLGGLGQILPNPYLLIRPLQRQEAVLSSRIEGTQASLSDLYVYEGAHRTARALPDDVQEVHNYVQALEYGLEQVSLGMPVSLRLVRELHAILMDGVRGNWSAPGEFRRTQNWIGPAGCRLEEAVFVPTPPETLMEALHAWEQFLHAPSHLPPLVRLALAHYQFEAIHPFLDGNGRVGRLLTVLLFVAWEVLPQPLLYLSAYMERRRQMYYALLLDVSQRGSWELWLRYFLHGVAEQSQIAVKQGQRLLALHTAYRRQYDDSSKLQTLIDMLFENPFVTGAMVINQLDVSSATAYQYLAQLEDDGILQEVTGRKRGRRYVAREILDVIEDAE